MQMWIEFVLIGVRGIDWIDLAQDSKHSDEPSGLYKLRENS
jgi:hypothetical protein